MNKKYIYIANWKSYFTYRQANDWMTINKNALATLAKREHIAICPSFESLSTIRDNLNHTNIKLGAQNCSAHNAGAFTGQILIESLKELGCDYCIIGHPEVQRLCTESADILAQKIQKLLHFQITPILCIGETAQDYELSRGAQSIRHPLEPILTHISKQQDLHTLAIAYEPLWAINSNSTPPSSYIQSQLEEIDRLCKRIIPQFTCLKLYGGGVDETNTRQFKNIDILDGFLIGRASTDFQKLQKIVEL